MVLCALLVAAHAEAQTRRALLIAINDYTASKLGVPAAPAVRDVWPNLTGTVNDVAAWRELLVEIYGFKASGIATLTDQQATRGAILKALGELAAKTGRGDTVFFYYAGHGSQVANSLSDEPDKLDESIVPADSRIGALDIRDKELRPFFNRMLDRGARLTVILDACHSGSGARGMPGGGTARGVSPDLRDVRDGRDYGPRPEERGALVLSASQDFDLAWETRDDRRKPRGVFTWAWLSALRDAANGEAAEETFLRAKARVYAERPYQEPVIAGIEAVRRAPFLGTRADRRGGRAVVAVAGIRHYGTVLLQGGWANGLAAGSKLRGPGNSRLTVKDVTGLTRSEARLDAGRVKPGMLLEHDAWTMPFERALRVSIPRSSQTIDAKSIKAAALNRGIRWIDDPTEEAITHSLRWAGKQWELVAMSGIATAIGADPIEAFATLPKNAAVFVQFPLLASSPAGAWRECADEGVMSVGWRAGVSPASIGRLARSATPYTMGLSPGETPGGCGRDARPPSVRGGSRVFRMRDGVSSRAKSRDPLHVHDARSVGGRSLDFARDDTRGGPVSRPVAPDEACGIDLVSHHAADYILTGRYKDSRIEYAWIRPFATKADARKTGLPARTAWTTQIDELQDHLRRLRTIHGWQTLQSPAGSRYPYRLQLPQQLRGGQTYGLTLKAAAPLQRVGRRYIYLFAIDSHGKSSLLFPTSGSVENRFPIGETPPAEIDLGACVIEPPYGVETFLLLTSEEPLPNPWILEWEGVRAARAILKGSWSVDCLIVETVPPK